MVFDINSLIQATRSTIPRLSRTHNVKCRISAQSGSAIDDLTDIPAVFSTHMSAPHCTKFGGT